MLMCLYRITVVVYCVNVFVEARNRVLCHCVCRRIMVVVYCVNVFVEHYGSRVLC